MDGRITYIISEAEYQPEEGLRLDVRVLEEPCWAYNAGARVMPDGRIQPIIGSRRSPPLASLKAAVRAYLTEDPVGIVSMKQIRSGT